jgi:PAS domain S-box-containing protein
MPDTSWMVASSYPKTDTKILIVDDELAHGTSVRDLLAAHDYASDVETRGANALKLLATGRYQLLILDLNMPGMTGIDVLEAIQDAGLDVKTIVLSGESAVSTVTPILRLGAYDYLPKPFEPQQLLVSVANALDHFGLEQQNRAMGAQAEADNRRHAFLVNASPDLIYMLDENGNFSFLNNQLQNIFNFSPEDLQERPWQQLVGPQLEQSLDHRFNERRTGERATRKYQFDYTTTSGEQRIFEFSAMGLYENRTAADVGRHTGTYGVLRDVTEARLTARELEQSQRKFYGLFMESPDAVYIARLSDGLLLEGNDNFRHTKWILGAADETSDGFIFSTLSTQESSSPEIASRDEFVARLRHTPNHMTFTVEHELGDGPHYYEINARILELDGEECVLATMRDRTTERRAETDRLTLQTQLQQASKMEAIGQLAGGIAHDFNNILASIIGYAELVLSARNRLAAEQVDNYLEEVVTAGHRARDLISQMLTFTRASPRDASSIDVTSAITDVSRMLRAAIPATIDINTEYGDGLRNVMADQVQLQQVIMNLLINARDAIQGNGTITISVVRGNQANVCASCSEKLTDEHIVLSVTDTGHGIPEALLDKVFEMYFTTREAGKGTGMGLWLINNLIHGYGGHVTVESEVDRGTTFRVHLPIATAPVQIEAEPKSTSSEVAGQIVVVDDEASVGNFIGEVLRDHGLEVVIFYESPTAFRYLQTNIDDLALLITDQAMPLLSGLDLSEQAKALRPDLPIILITAFAESRDTVRMERIGIDRFLAKPFRIDELMGAIYELTPSEGATRAPVAS